MAPVAGGTGRVEHVDLGAVVRFNLSLTHLPELAGARPAVVQAILDAATWKLADRPPASRSRLSDTRGAKIRLRPDVPGRYRVRVTIVTRLGSRSAAVNLSVTEAGPLVPFDSVDYDGSGHAGVVVGSQRYAGTGNGLQVVVLDRITLELQQNASFPATSSGISAMDSMIKPLDASHLVIVTNPGGTAVAGGYSPVLGADAAALNTTLGRIGGAYPGNWVIGASSEVSCWSGGQQYCYVNSGWAGPKFPSTLSPFSVAGVPGMALGQAWRDTAVQRHARDGRLAGYLVSASSVDNPEGTDAYSIVRGADQYVQVNTCASGGPSACVVKVGTQTFTPTPGINGMFVVQLDRTTLAPLSQATVATAGDLATELQKIFLPATVPGHLLIPGMDDQRLVIVQSVGTGRLTGTSGVLPQLFDEVGGTLEALAGAAGGGRPYALVGVADDLPWTGHGTESSPVIKAVQAGTELVELSRDRDGRFSPHVGDPAGTANLDLYGILYQALTPWSFAGSPVLPWLGQQLALPPDIRSAYPNRAVDFSSKLALLVSTPCPADHDSLGFSCDDFTAVQNELKIEFDGVQSVRGLVDSMSAPFQLSSQTQEYSVQTIADAIQASLQPPPTSSSSWGWLGQFSTAMNIASDIASLSGQDQASTVFGLLAASADMTSELMTTADGSSSTDLTSEVKDLSSQLASQNLSQLEAFGGMELILVADQAKLLTVRQSVGTDPRWAWTQATTNDAVSTLNAAAAASTYADLMPLSWPVWDIQPKASQSGASTAAALCSGEDVDDAGQPYYPFKNALAANQFQAITNWPSVTQTRTFAHLSDLSAWWDDHPDRHTSLPTTSLTTGIFSPQNGGADQYPPTWFRTVYNPPGRAICSTNYNNTSDLSFARTPARSTVGPSDAMVR